MRRCFLHCSYHDKVQGCFPWCVRVLAHHDRFVDAVRADSSWNVRISGMIVAWDTCPTAVCSFQLETACMLILCDSCWSALCGAKQCSGRTALVLADDNFQTAFSFLRYSHYEKWMLQGCCICLLQHRASAWWRSGSVWAHNLIWEVPRSRTVVLSMACRRHNLEFWCFVFDFVVFLIWKRLSSSSWRLTSARRAGNNEIERHWDHSC